MSKPIVHYDKDQFCRIAVGGKAMVFPLDHPGNDGLVSNTSVVLTSTVISYNEETGEFETENSIYRPADNLK